MKWLTAEFFKWALPGLVTVAVVDPKPGQVIAFCFRERLRPAQIDLIHKQLDNILPKGATYIVLENGTTIQAVDFSKENRCDVRRWW